MLEELKREAEALWGGEGQQQAPPNQPFIHTHPI